MIVSIAVAALAVLAPLAQAQLPPGANPSLLDPVAYAALIQWKPCPNVGNQQNPPIDCNYPSTPTSGDVTWTCPAGFYCMGPSRKDACTPGFYCPVNAAQPLYCPRKFACSNDTTSISVCPKNYFCPVGTVSPFSCWFLAYCPAGSYEASKFAILLLFIVVAAAIYLVFYWKAKADEQRRHRHVMFQEEANRNLVATDKPAIKRLERTFDIKFDNLSLTLPNGVTIMSGVSGELKSGRTCAIMGPSGAGKTTFVTLLTGKVKRTTGEVQVNGKTEELSIYRKLIGYVPQEDIMLRELTVRDILMHSAKMRLPYDWSHARIKEKVGEIIAFLGMSHVISSIIGDEETRGISGGQRKRVNIGMELVAEPSVLFLDEPTSGLDSSTSYEVCSNLKNIARLQGLTVAAVIHSPSPATFRQFDDFMLLGKGGQLIYMGPRELCVEYFKSIGFTCPPDESPSDFFMDVATGKIPSEFDPAFDIKDLFTYWNKTRKGENPFANAKRMTIEEAIENREKFKRGELRATAADGTKVVPKIEAPKFRDYYGWTNYITDGIASMGREWGVWAFDVLVEFGEWLISIVNTIICRVDPIRETCAYHLQIWYLLRRAALQVYKDPQSIIIDMFLHFASGVFISTAVQNFKFLGAMPGSICATAPINLQWQCGRPEDHLKEAGMFVALGVLFAGISVGVNTFGREKVVYWRDTANGMNTIPYYLAKFIVDFPRVLLGATMYFIAVLIFFSFKQFPGSLFSIIICLYYGAFAMGYWISTAFPLSKAALIGTGFALLWALVLSGVIPSLDDVVDYPDALQWLWKVSAPRWGIEAFWLKEVSSLWWRERNLPPINQYQWDDYLPAFKHMLLIAVGWNVLAFLGLKLFNRSKQK